MSIETGALMAASVAVGWFVEWSLNRLAIRRRDRELTAMRVDYGREMDARIEAEGRAKAKDAMVERLSGEMSVIKADGKRTVEEYLRLTKRYNALVETVRETFRVARAQANVEATPAESSETRESA